MIKTFEEIIMNIKGHQIWKPLASDSRVKEIESIEFNNSDGILINLDDKYNCVFIPSNMKFELDRNEVSFEEVSFFMFTVCCVLKSLLEISLLLFALE